MGRLESTEKVEIMLILPEEIISEVRAHVLRAIGELFGTKSSLIECTRAQLGNVVDSIGKKYPELELVRGRVGCSFIIRQKSQSVRVEGRRIEAELTTGESGRKNPRKNREFDDAWDPIEHHVDGSWQRLSEDMSTARSLVYEANKPSKKRIHPKWRVGLNGCSFSYRGQTLPISKLTPLTLKGLRNWMAQVNREKKGSRRKELFS
jgi:hypothetical protein